MTSARSSVRVLLFPSDALRRRAELCPESAFGTSAFREYCQRMVNMFVAVERADVLAATQVEHPACRLLVLGTSNAGTAGAVLVNPVVRDLGGEHVGWENSASFACVPAMLSAPTKLVVEYRTPNGERRKVVCSRSGARAVFQGEESLNGKPLVDRMSAQAAHQFMRRYREELEERIAPAIFLPQDVETRIN
jgi:peptide deformylase